MRERSAHRASPACRRPRPSPASPRRAGAAAAGAPSSPTRPDPGPRTRPTSSLEGAEPVDFELRAVSADELPAYVRTDSAGFGIAVERTRPNMVAWELDRTIAAFDGDRIVGVSRNYSLELTLPGGAVLPAAGVSEVAVLPTHRRRGLLRSMMDRLLDDAVAHGEPVAMLTASEGGIYGRFGFGVVDPDEHRRGRHRGGRLPGRPARRDAPAGRARRSRARSSPRCSIARGACSPARCRGFDAWWTDEQFHREFGTRFDVVHESGAGTVDGYLTYGLRSEGTMHGPAYRLVFRELDRAHAGRLAGAVALRVRGRPRPHRRRAQHAPRFRRRLDAALAARRAQTEVRDFLWTRLLDVPTALGAADLRGTRVGTGRSAGARGARRVPSGSARRRPVRGRHHAERRARRRGGHDRRHRTRPRAGRRGAVRRVARWRPVLDVGARRARSRR